MNIKSILLASIAAAICSSASAQDKMYKRNGDVIEGKVVEVGTKTISYKKADNPDGPNYVIEKGYIDRIEYQNGTEEYVGDDRRRMMHHDDMEENERKRPKVHYRNNIIAIAPLQVTDAGVGVGLSYERVLDKKGYVSFYMPVSWSFMNDNNGPYYSGNDYRNNTFYFMPGLKFYPTGSKGKVRYAIGPNIVAGFGREWQDIYYSYPYYNGGYYGSGYYVREQDDRFVLGVMVNNSLNINPTPHLYLGLELGMGVSYINQLNSFNDNERFLAQFGFKLGYRF